VRPDAERERQHGHRSEAGVLQQLAEGEFEIIHCWVGVSAFSALARYGWIEGVCSFRGSYSPPCHDSATSGGFSGGLESGVGCLLLELDDGHSDYPIRFLLLLHQACDFSVFAFDGDRGVAFLSFFILELGFQGRFSLLERLLPFAGG